MAFNFVKKIFSFAKDQAEDYAGTAAEKPADSAQPTGQVPPAAEVALPATEVLPPIRQPAPVAADPLAAEIAPEPGAIADAPLPHSLPDLAPVRREESAPDAMLPEPPAPAAPSGQDAARDSAAPPAAEILPPIRHPAPIVPDPVIAEIAPEPAMVPPPVPDAPPPLPPEPAKVVVTRKVEPKAAPAPEAPAAPRPTWFQRMREGLARSSRELSSNIAGVFTKRKLDEDTLQDLEDVLIRADLGMETAIRVTDALSASRYGKDVSDTDVRTVMAAEIEKVLAPVAKALELDLSHKPHVILVVGVNGTGKTTTIGKLAAKLTAGGLSVMLAAGDTFRAAAIEQLKIWGERTGAPVIASKLGADAAGLAFDAFARAKEQGADVLIIDTAGRLQNKAELMAELEKIVRVLGRLDPEAPHTVLQTVDATTGQNALNQVEIFRNLAGVNGLVMTKLDGTARGGILVAIAAKHKLPVYFIGVGEQIDDLEPFSASEFARAIAGVA
ncbi:MAG: signal recognition particle-docking protein FtsY [Mesorhizobium sp.]|nr:signal recognition particle-docking protein FtsY [Mesorhizobium sp.]